MQEVSGSIPLFSTKKALYFVGSMVLFFFIPAKRSGVHRSPCRRASDTPNLKQNRYACSVFRAASAMPRSACVSLRWRSFYGRRWITQAAHLKKPRRGFFPRRTVRRVDAVRIHPPSLREGYYKTETPVPGSDTGVLGGAKQPKSEPLPSGASLAAISSKVMVFVPSL